MSILTPEASTTTPDPREQRTPTALYRLYGPGGTLLYIGVTDDPDRRFKQHRDSKLWWPQVARKTVDWHPRRSLALAEEATAIRAEAPVYNIEHNPAAVSYRWPPAGMPADRVDAIDREVSTLPADLAEGIRRAAWEGFTTAQRVMAASLDRLIAALPDAVDESMRNAIPHRYTPELAARFAQAMIDELRAQYAMHSGEPTAPIHAEAKQILTQCCQRRPDRDPATGDLLSGVEDTDETSLDRLLCVERHGHDGDHRDAMRRTWTRQAVTA